MGITSAMPDQPFRVADGAGLVDFLARYADAGHSRKAVVVWDSLLSLPTRSHFPALLCSVVLVGETALHPGFDLEWISLDRQNFLPTTPSFLCTDKNSCSEQLVDLITCELAVVFQGAGDRFDG